MPDQKKDVRIPSNSRQVFFVKPPKEAPLVSTKSKKHLPTKAEEVVKIGVRGTNEQSLFTEASSESASDVRVKNDTFLPSDDSEHSGSDTDASLKKIESRTCPSCFLRVHGSGRDYHCHLYWCLCVTKNIKIPTLGKDDSKASNGHKSSSEAKMLLGNLQAMISKLDLTFRINTAESLRRMAKNTESSSLLFPQLNNDEVDSKVLSLVYGKQQEVASNSLSLIIRTAKGSAPTLHSNPALRKRRRLNGAISEKLALPVGKRSRKIPKVTDLNAEILKIEIANHTPLASASKDYNRRFAPVALEDLFLLPPHARVPKTAESAEWEKHILKWQESNRSELSSLPMNLPFSHESLLK